MTVAIPLLLAAGLMAGFGRVDLEPPAGHSLAGYFSPRPCEGVLDPVEANCVALSDGSRSALLYSLDLVEVKGLCDRWRREIAAATGVAPESVYIACTHTHTAPSVGRAADSYEISVEGPAAYDDAVLGKLVSAGKAALSDLAPAAMRLGRAKADGLSFVRRYRMKDGKVKTNPGKSKLDQVVGPAGEADSSVGIVRLDRTGRPPIAMVNFQCHPDMVGGRKASADWPGFMRRALERDLGARAILFNGAQGDTNHIDIRNPRHGYEASRTFGETLAAAVRGTWNDCEVVEAGSILAEVRLVKVPIRVPTAEELANTNGLTKVAMNRLAKLRDAPRELEIPVSCVSIDRALVFCGLPCEPFTEIGREAKRNSSAKATFFTCLTNGSFGYLPTDDAYDEGAYETDSAIFAPGASRALLRALHDMMTNLKQRKEKPL